jgi:hypothetical protein
LRAFDDSKGRACIVVALRLEQPPSEQLGDSALPAKVAQVDVVE